MSLATSIIDEAVLRPGVPSIRVEPTRVAPPPSAPLPVARAFAQSVFTTPAGLLLRHHRDSFYLWNGAYYGDIDKRDIRGAAYRWLEHAEYHKGDSGLVSWSPTRRKIDDVLDAMRSAALIDSRIQPPAWLDSRDGDHEHPDSIRSLANGLLHVPSRTLHAHTSRFFCLYGLPFDFDPDPAPPRRWLAFLDQLWAEDASSIDALQEIFGYLLAGGTERQKIFLLVGPPRSGKSTIGRVLTGLLGAHHVAAPTLSGLSSNFGLAPLVTKPLAIIADARIRADSHIVVERLLSISGEDTLTVDRKHRDQWTGQLPTRFLILTNELPRLADTSGALASRFVPLVLTRSFFGHENPRLTDALLLEAPSIFGWALKGLDRLNSRGYFITPRSGAAALQQLADLSSPTAAFIRDVCVVMPGASVAVETLWIAWKRWCESENRPPGTKSDFGKDLKAAIPTVDKKRPRDGADRAYVYVGIGLGGRSHDDVRVP